MKYTPFSQFILRAPSVSFARFRSILSDKKLLLEELSKSQILEAIYLASPSLYNELKKLIDGKVKDNNEIDRILSSTIRYYSRMSTRCTPFGLFASCMIGDLGIKSEILLDTSISRKTRLDMFYLYALYDSFIQNQAFRREMKYYPNSSIYEYTNKYRYIESYPAASGRKYCISEVERSKYLNKILRTALDGAYYSSIVEVLTRDEIPESDAIEFINELIDSQLLVGELNQAVTGDDFLSRLIQTLDTTKIDLTIRSLLKNISKLLQNLDNNPINFDMYNETINTIKQLSINYEDKFLFQVDTISNSNQPQLGEEVISELKSAIQFLNKITPFEEIQQLKKFKEDFFNRYEYQEVPLMEVLDPECGLGYPSKKNDSDISPLINDLKFPEKQQNITLSLSTFDDLLLRKVVESTSLNRDEIIFNENDVEHLSINWDNLPHTIYTLFQVIHSKKNTDAIIKLEMCGGSSGANLISRFAHLDKKIEQLILNITSKEQELEPNALLAEIVHMPSDRIGNVLLRPHIRAYEILYMANTDLPQGQQIFLSDLMISLKNNRLILRSKKLNKEIIPRLTSAHNYVTNSMPAYHFLCELQTQSMRRGLFLNWGNLIKILPFRPRVRYKNTIISPASWTVKHEEIRDLFLIKSQDELLIKSKTWRLSRKIPTYTYFTDGDNKLFTDWENTMSINSLFEIIKKREIMNFEEFLFNEADAIVKNQLGEAYLNEFIVPFYKNEI